MLANRQLYHLLFTIFNYFVASKHYDGKDRHLMKLFLKEAQEGIREILGVQDTVKIDFFLTIFETQC